MSKILAWFIAVDQPSERIELPMQGYLNEVHRRIGGSGTLDATRVRYNGRLCTMFVDDTGMVDGLPVNEAATQAYRANCRPGTTHTIHGPAVIVGGKLP